MSKVGKQILNIPEGVTVDVNAGNLTVKGKLGELKKVFDNSKVDIIVDGSNVSFKLKATDARSKGLWGTWAAHTKNMIKGVSEGFAKKLLIEGVGYKWEVAGSDLKLSLGYSHPVVLAVPAGLALKADKTSLEISGFDKELVGSFAMKVRLLRLPEPYKGKGIRYSDEVIRRKQGKRSA